MCFYDNILEREIPITWNGMTKQYYINKGYVFTKMGDTFLVKIQDLHENSTFRVTRICPSCGKQDSIQFRKIYSRGHCLCNKCSKRKIAQSNMPTGCYHCGIKRDYYRYYDGKPYCDKHYNQIKQEQDFHKSIYDRNDIIIYADHAEIILRNKMSVENGRALIDLEDIDKIKDIKWRLYENYHTNYVYGCKNGCGSIKLHRVIMDCPDNMVVDHINHNGMDNRKINLKICTHKENSANLTKHKQNREEWLKERKMRREDELNELHED